MYPQISLPKGADEQMSSSLADLVVGDFDFEGMDHQTRIMRLFALIKAIEYVKEVGELEHTSDWDWRITIVWGEANLPVGSVYTDDVENDTWSDTFELRYETEPNDYIQEFQRWHYLTVEVWPNSASDDPTYVLIPIDEIQSIAIGFA